GGGPRWVTAATSSPRPATIRIPPVPFIAYRFGSSVPPSRRPRPLGRPCHPVSALGADRVDLRVSRLSPSRGHDDHARGSGGLGVRGSTSNPARRHASSPPLREWTCLNPRRWPIQALVASLGSAQ